MADNETTHGLVARFWGFDRLLGSVLIKTLYYIGFFAILIITALSIASAFVDLGSFQTEFAAQSPLENANPIWVVVGSLIGGIVALIVWRYVCELSLLLFQIYNRLGEIRDRLPDTEANDHLASHV